MDYYSLWPEVYQLHQIMSTDVITVMKDIFSKHGIPEELVSDNGTQYKSHKSVRYLSHNLKPRISTIKWVGRSLSQNDQNHDKETSRNQARHHRGIADHPKHTFAMWIQPSTTSNWMKTERQSSVYASIKQCYTKT